MCLQLPWAQLEIPVLAIVVFPGEAISLFKVSSVKGDHARLTDFQQFVFDHSYRHLIRSQLFPSGASSNCHLSASEIPFLLLSRFCPEVWEFHSLRSGFLYVAVRACSGFTLTSSLILNQEESIIF